MALLYWLLALFYIYTYPKNMSSKFLVDDTMTSSQTLKDGQTLVSSNRRFELGFFSPSHKKNRRYLGIWYKGIQPLTVVWVANPEKPLQDSNASLQLNSEGGLVLFDRRNTPIFIYRPSKNVSKPFLQISYTGNLVVADEGQMPPVIVRYLWQSFDYPSDTLLPGMRIGWSYKPQKFFVLTSWNNADDPSPGDFTLGLDKSQLPQMLLQKKSIKLSRWGPWQSDRFSASALFGTNSWIDSFLNTSDDEVRFTYTVWDDVNELVRLQVTHFGKFQLLAWNQANNKWDLILSNKDFCDDYNACGPYGICHNEKPNCRCLNGFVSNTDRNRHQMAGAGGCEREIRKKCDSGDYFKKFEGLKLPDKAVAWPNLNARQCERKCFDKCNCNAYSIIDVYGNGSNCVVWLDDLLDIGGVPSIGDALHIRMSVKPPGVTLGPIPSFKKDKEKNVILISIVSSICVLVFSVLLFLCCSRMLNTKRLDRQRSQQRNWSSNEEENLDFKLFEVDIITEATDDFCDANEIGRGGFGRVYKGILHNGQEIAVKRLSSSSGQGQEQFENESGLIARLQHRNLVKLVGCCVHEEERMLVYEYLPNRSLDKLIFDQARKILLSWAKRVDIILGVAKGLAYLHDDSGLRIVHRDLKASNILLDREMTPKISDFGLAKIFGNDNELNERARKVYGTLGYVAPEYQMNGQLSTKSDVFSFGVLLLEIISGKRNPGFRHPDHNMNLLGHAWTLWREGSALKLMDPALEDLSFETQILRCIQVGLLCAQSNPEYRPTMSTVVFMLSNETMVLPEPTVPGFFPEDSCLGLGSPLLESFNGLTVTTLNAR